MEAQKQELTSQTAADTQRENQFTSNQAAEQAALSQDLTNRQNVINQTNEQTQALSDKANQAVSQGTAAVTPASLQQSQADQVAAQSALNAPNVQNIQTSNPLGAADTGVTKDAMDAGNAEAAKYVKNYGDTLADLSGYNAPLQLANTTATGINTALMPLSAQNQLIQTSAPALLAPSTLAYQQDQAYAGDVNQANAMTYQGETGLAQDTASNETTLANLLQGDTNTNIQNTLSLKQMADAAMAGVGTGVTSLANTGLNFAASQGAFNGLFNTTPAVPNGTAAPVIPVTQQPIN